MIKRSFEELLLTGKLPSPAGVGMRILQITRTDDFSANEMGETIRSDSALTGRILKLANGAIFAGSQPATTVNEAIMRLGSRTVRDLSLAFSLVSERRRGGCKTFDFERYWSKSLSRAVCAQALSRAARCGSPQEAYICGLLGEVGRLALAAVYPDKYGEMIESGLMNDSEALAKAEDEAFGIDNRQLAACLISEWGLPDGFVLAIRDYGQRPHDGESDSLETLTSILRHADNLAASFVGASSTTREAWERYTAGLDRTMRLLKYDESRFEELFDGCVREWVSWGEEMEIAVERGMCYRRMQELSRASVAASPRPDRASVAVDETASSPEPENDPVHILAVDDEPLQRRLISKYLSQDGYAVTIAGNGEEALRLALEKAPDIVIADYMMPEMDGLELCRLLRKTEVGSKMYFLLLTGRTEPEMLIEAFEAGCDDFVTKPFVPRLLVARIKGGVRVVNLQRKVEADRITMVRQMAELGVLTRKLRSAAMTDALTGLFNRRYAMKRLESEWSFTVRTGRPMTLIMADIDHFKVVNDQRGHDAGDFVLVETARVLRQSLRESDEVCRLGGEEFLVICRNTSQEEGGLVAERLRKAVSDHMVRGEGFESHVTISLGVAGWHPGIGSEVALLKAADEAMYESKRKGRNRFSYARQSAGQKKSA